MLNNIIQQINNSLDNPEGLSRLCVELSAQLFYMSKDIAQAETTEAAERNRVRAFSSDKKMTIAEVDDIAVVNTKNKYKELKLELETAQELINAAKKRIEVLSWERQKA